MSLTQTPAQLLQELRLRMPGMLPREILVFANWEKAHAAEYDRFDFNLRVGSGFDPGPQFEVSLEAAFRAAGIDLAACGSEFCQNMRQMAIKNTQKRIDAVAWKADQATLIEVKDRAGFSAVGQLVGYRPLFKQLYPDKPAPLLLLVTNRLAPDIVPALQEIGVAWEVVQTDFSKLAGLRKRRR